MTMKKTSVIVALIILLGLIGFEIQKLWYRSISEAMVSAVAIEKRKHKLQVTKINNDHVKKTKQLNKIHSD